MCSGKVITCDKWKRYYYSSCYREACYNCKYTTPNRYTDFTIADYWGIERNVPAFDDNQGTSLVLARTPKAKQIMEKLTDIQKVKTTLTSSMQPQLLEPCKIGEQSEKFWKAYLQNNKKAIKHFFFKNKARQLAVRINEFIRIVCRKLRRVLTSIID